MAAVLTRHRPGDARGQASALDCRQLCHPPTCQGAEMVKRHPRFHVHFTPTSSSWLNMVERFFRDLTQNRLRRGVFRDVEELIMAIGAYIDRHNENPKPFIWTAKASDILEKVKRA